MYEWSEDDADAFISFCAALGIADHTVPLRCWANESNCDPAAWNRGGNASGIFQLMPSTAKGLGYDVTADPTLAVYRTWTVAQQLQLAVKYYASERAYLGTVAGFYCVTFLPAMAHLVGDLTATICAVGGPYAFAYNDNKGFDRSDKGFICGQDLVDATERAYGPRAQAIAALVARHVDTLPELPPLSPGDAAVEATTGLLDPDATLPPDSAA